MSPRMRDPQHLPDVFWGNFLGNEVGFVCEHTYRHLEWPEALKASRTNLSSVYSDHSGFPDMNGAPLASWFFARVAFLAGERFPYKFGEVICTNPDETLARFYCLTRVGNPLGLLYCMGEASMISLHLLHGPEMDGLLVLRAFMEALLSEPSWVAKVRVIVQAASGFDERCQLPRVFGWDGEKYLNGTSFPLGDLRMKYHARTYDLLRFVPQVSQVALEQVLEAEQRLGFEFPPSVRELYTSNLFSVSPCWQNDELVELEELSVQKWQSLEIMPFAHDAHGVGVVLALLLDGSDDPPVYMHNDNERLGEHDDIQVRYWNRYRASFTDYVYSFVWEYVFISWYRIFGRTECLSDLTIAHLKAHFTEDLRTYDEYRFIHGSIGIYIWQSIHDSNWEWTIASPDPASLEETVRILWAVDGLGCSLGSNFTECKKVIELFRQQSRD